MKIRILKCGFHSIPYILHGKENAALTNKSLELCKSSLKILGEESASEDLSNNYQLNGLHLNKMLSFKIIYNLEENEPVFISGLQRIGDNSARVFSRYYVFKKYRTIPSRSNLYSKLDDFEVLQNDIEEFSTEFPFLFWSRERGTSFFKGLKRSRPDVFSEWTIHPTKVEIIYPKNYQGIFYFNKSSKPANYFIENELKA